LPSREHTRLLSPNPSPEKSLSLRNLLPRRQFLPFCEESFANVRKFAATGGLSGPQRGLPSRIGGETGVKAFTLFEGGSSASQWKGARAVVTRMGETRRETEPERRFDRDPPAPRIVPGLLQDFLWGNDVLYQEADDPLLLLYRESESLQKKKKERSAWLLGEGPRWCMMGKGPNQK